MLCENYFDGGGSLFTAVYVRPESGEFHRDSEHFVGFTYGFVGVRDREQGFRSPENLVFYSQYLAVRKAYQHYGLGLRMKEYQGQVVRDLLGIGIMTCTYDPLVGVNAYRNIHHFRMKVLEYVEALYQDFGGDLNRTDVPSDRLYVSWDLRKPASQPEIDLEALFLPENLAVWSDIREISGRSGRIPMEVCAGYRTGLDREVILVEIPVDFYRMLRETDVSERDVRSIPVDWRMKTRAVFQDLLDRGYRVADFQVFKHRDRKRDFYVFRR
ncbi:MAG: hypothetical protein ACE5LV_10845, partial [Candidatus Aminicenantales bacterium]